MASPADRVHRNCSSCKEIEKPLFKCLSCGIEAHRDVVGVLNIARLHGDGFNGVLAHPSLLRAEKGVEVKADEIPMSVMPSEARISPL